MPLPPHIIDAKYKIAMACERCGNKIAQRRTDDPLGGETMMAWAWRRQEFIDIHRDCPSERKSAHKLDEPRK